VVERCLKASGGTEVYFTDHGFGVVSDGELDAPAVLRISRSGHQPCADQPINHCAGGWRAGTQCPGYVGEADWCLSADDVQRGEL
jgi:hypothetical protein